MDSKALLRAKSLVKSKLGTPILSQLSHHLIAGHNKNQFHQTDNESLDDHDVSEMFQEYPYNCDLPKPILPPSKIQRDCSGREDLSMQLVYTKAKIQDDVNRYLEMYKKHSKVLDRNVKENIEWIKKDGKSTTKLPKYLALTSEILECDPDPYFSGNYNWYYSGGTLNKFLYGMRNILVFPFAQELIALPVKLNNDLLLEPDFKNAAKIAINDRLFQIDCCTANNNGRILTRYRNDCFVYSLFNMDKKKLQLLEVGKQPSEVPYTSAALDPININRYCTTNTDRNIKIWDIMKSKQVLNGNVPVTQVLEDNWSCIKYDPYKSDILNYVDRHCIYYYDIRLPIDRPVLKMCPKDQLEDCENLSCYVASCKSGYFSYIGSNHSLCLLDNRCPDDAVVKKWTHQFKSSPLFTDVCLRDNNEFVIITSQMAGETSIVLNSWNSNEEAPKSCCMPFTPPSALETLIALQSQGKCLNPFTRNRLLSCNTGCITTIDVSSGDIFLLTQNSINDIFYQGIGHQEHIDLYSLENCKALHNFEEWEKQMLKNSQYDIISPLVVTQRTDARDVLRNFTNKELQPTDNDEQQNESLDYDPSWQRTIAELNSYVDIFAPELLAPWEMVEDAPLVPITAAPHQKVLSWLGMSQESQEEGVSKESSDLQQPAVIEIQDLEIKPDNDLFLVHDSESIQQLFLPKVKSQGPSGKKNMKRQYVPGF